MTGFSSKWLDLREPIDHAARSEAVLSALSHYFLNDQKLVVTDIGCGTGSTIRALKGFLIKEITWHLVDNDDLLLTEAAKHTAQDHVQCTNADLSQSLDAIFKPHPDLMTTSAFLDLVSRDWLEIFVVEVTRRKIPFYAALTYDGRGGTNPSAINETAILTAFNTHQKTNKGFGPALGPDAADTAIMLFEKAGYVVCQEPSDWVAGPKFPEFQKMLLDGWRSAACEISPPDKAEFETWFNECLAYISNEQLHLTVGHKDFLAVPA